MSWSQRLLALVQQVEKSAFGVGFDGASRQKETVQEPELGLMAWLLSVGRSRFSR